MPFGISVWELLILFFLVVVAALPAYIVAMRSGVKSPGLAFIPYVGAFIVLLRVIGKSGWLTLLVLIPYLGGLILYIWLAVEIPKRHARSGWWSVAFIVLPLVSFYAYALTLPETGPEAAPSLGEA